MTNTEKYREMIRLYQTPYCEEGALELAKELLTAKLPKSKMDDVKHVYERCTKICDQRKGVKL